MPSVQLDSDVAGWLEYVLRIMPSVPIELQLVWLYEVIVKTYLQRHPEHFKKVKDAYVISIEYMFRMISGSFTELKTLRALYKFSQSLCSF